MKNAQKPKARVKSALVCPVFVLSAICIILLLLMKFVIPLFTTVLAERQEPLPVWAKCILSVSSWMTSTYGWVVLLAIPFVFIVILIIVKITKHDF